MKIKNANQEKPEAKKEPDVSPENARFFSSKELP